MFLRCTSMSVLCAGTVIFSGFVARAATDAAPVTISCDVQEHDQSDDPSSVTVGATLMNTSEQPATRVAIRINLLDKSGKTTTSTDEFLDGDFGPQTLIKPRRLPISQRFVLAESDPKGTAWKLTYPGDNFGKATCDVVGVRFADGTLWRRASTTP